MPKHSASETRGKPVIDCNQEAAPQSEVRFTDVPSLEGSLEIVTETDAGNRTSAPPSSRPCAVLRPTSITDIQKMVRDCAIRGVPVAARGRGTSSEGFALCPEGLEIDMRSLRGLQMIDPSTIRVGAGALWSEVLERTLAHGRRPAVLTRLLDVSVGGTLSLGGLGPNYMEGSQADSVRSLTIVTGTGEKVTAHRDHRAELFHGALGGLGQFGVIADATIKLEPALEFTSSYCLSYDDPQDFFSAMSLLLKRQEADELYGLGIWRAAGGWNYQLHVAVHFENGREPTAAELIGGLPRPPGGMTTTTLPYERYARRFDRGISTERGAGRFHGFMRPRFSTLLPESKAQLFCSQTVPHLTERDLGRGGTVALYPQRSAAFESGVTQIPPASKWIYLFELLTAAADPRSVEVFEQELCARNQRLHERARQLGALRYPGGALDFTESDWREHFGRSFERLATLKSRLDPSRVLAGGRSIFSG